MPAHEPETESQTEPDTQQDISADISAENEQGSAEAEHELESQPDVEAGVQAADGQPETGQTKAASEKQLKLINDMTKKLEMDLVDLGKTVLQLNYNLNDNAIKQLSSKQASDLISHLIEIDKQKPAGQK